MKAPWRADPAKVAAVRRRLVEGLSAVRTEAAGRLPWLVVPEGAPPASAAGCLTVLVCGESGTGKSTLINALLGRQAAATGTGQPVTAAIAWHRHPALPLLLGDTPGLELRRSDRQGRVLQGLLAWRRRRGVDLVWLCQPLKAPRLSQPIRDLLAVCREEDVPFVVVLTRASGSVAAEEAMRRAVAEVAPDAPVVAVLAEPQFDPQGQPLEDAHGLEELLRRSVALLPREGRGRFADLPQRWAAVTRR